MNACLKNLAALDTVGLFDQVASVHRLLLDSYRRRIEQEPLDVYELTADLTELSALTTAVLVLRQTQLTLLGNFPSGNPNQGG